MDNYERRLCVGGRILQLGGLGWAGIKRGWQNVTKITGKTTGFAQRISQAKGGVGRTYFISFRIIAAVFSGRSRMCVMYSRSKFCV